MKEQKFKAVIFDKDGVLIDSLDTCLVAFNETLSHYGKPVLSKEKYVKEFWGIKAGENTSRIFGNLPKEKLEEIIIYYRKKRTELEHNTKLYPNALHALEALKGKYKIGLVTNTTRSVMLRILKDFNILKYFDVVVGGDETEPKPSPKPLLKACKLLDIKPEEALYIGDTMSDIQASKAAGCTTVIVTTSMSKEELAGIRGIIIIDDLNELKEILKIA